MKLIKGEIMKCIGCSKKPSEIHEYIYLARQQKMTPRDFVKYNEGSLNRKTGEFLCTLCYIKAGMPLLEDMPHMKNE